MNSRDKILASMAIMIYCISLLQPVSAGATTIWTETFNDGNYNDWTIKGYYFPLDDSWSIQPGEAEVVNDQLWFTGNQIFRNFTFAIHESVIASGSWTFDVFINSSYQNSNHTHIYFIDDRSPDQIPDFGDSFCCYDIMIYSEPWGIDKPNWLIDVDDTAPSFLLIKRPGITVLGNFSVEKIKGWQHIDVTRDESGLFKVYINNTLRIEVLDNTYTESKSFYLESETGIGYDNITVRDEVLDFSNISTSESNITSDTTPLEFNTLPRTSQSESVPSSDTTISPSLTLHTVTLAMVITYIRIKSNKKNNN